MKYFSRVVWGFVVFAVVGLIAFMFYKSWKMAKDVVANERLKLEKERLSILYQINNVKQNEDFKSRTPIGFKAS